LLSSVAFATAVVAVPARVSAATLPPGFGDTLVATVGSPTAIAFTPDGRMLVTTQPGLLRVVQGGSLLPTPALDLSTQICSNSERGLLGVAVDPQFASNKFIYLYWTFKNAGSCPTGNFTSPVNRVARYVLPDNNVISQGTEMMLLDNMPSTNGNHNGGDLNFGPDGNLYASIGDGGVLGESRKDHMLSGKILRITRDGAIPPGNPNAGTGTARCNLTGRTTAGTKCQETFATGLRNPFRIAFDPNSATPKFHINDVGQNHWEEIDLGQTGADYGYNLREGHCAFASTTNCGTVAGLVNPIFDYGRDTGCAAITGGAFVPNGLWGAPWDGKYLFSDYTCGKIFRLEPNGSGGFTMVEFVGALLSSSAVHLEFGPFGSSQALYFTTYRDGGQVRRISQTTTPSAEMTANPTSGPAPLLVNFDGSASTDPNNDPLTYLWDFGDGNTDTTTVPTTSHTYQTVGSFNATLRVRDPGGLTSLPASRTIQPGNTAPLVTMASPVEGSKFNVGQNLTLNGTATDSQDGTLSASRLSWVVLRHHGNHDHPTSRRSVPA
jgi:glucose/arabinose dehydrogenase